MEEQYDHLVQLVSGFENEPYKWCLKEFDSDGKEVGKPLIPNGDTISFVASKFKYHCKVATQRHGPLYRYMAYYMDPVVGVQDDNDLEDWPVEEFQLYEHIEGTLTPSGNKQRGQSFSFLGTNREIELFDLIIEKTEEERCLTRGLLAYTERGKTEPDRLQVHICLKSEKFNFIKDLIHSKKIDSATLLLHGVEGLYGTTSDSKYASFLPMKLLEDEEIVENSEKDQDKLTSLGRIFEFELRF